MKKVVTYFVIATTLLMFKQTNTRVRNTLLCRTLLLEWFSLPQVNGTMVCIS